jgi:DNA replication protein DnaC
VVKTDGTGQKNPGAEMNRAELPEREFECRKHGKYRGRPLRLPFLDEPHNPPCPVCGAERAAREAAARDREAAADRERLRLKRVKRLEDLNIGQKFWDESFETFDAYTPELKEHFEACRDFTKNHRGRMLVMLGNNGTGKNHLAASILKTTGGVMYTVYEIELLLRQSYAGETREYQVINRLCEAETLVIDEIGRTKSADWELNWLSHVINKRYGNCRPTVLISNKHLKDDCPRGDAGCPDCLQNWVGNDVLSRIIEIGLVMEFTGEDYRSKKRMAGRNK